MGPEALALVPVELEDPDPESVEAEVASGVTVADGPAETLVAVLPGLLGPLAESPVAGVKPLDPGVVSVAAVAAVAVVGTEGSVPAPARLVAGVVAIVEVPGLAAPVVPSFEAEPSNPLVPVASGRVGRCAFATGPERAVAGSLTRGGAVAAGVGCEVELEAV